MTDVDVEMVSVSAKKAPASTSQKSANATTTAAPAEGLSVAIVVFCIVTFALSLATLIIVAITLPRVNTVQGVLESIGSAGGACEAPLGLPGMEALTWSAITARAATQELQFYLYEYDPTTWFVNDVLATVLKRDYSINVFMQPAVYSGCGLNGSSLAVVCQVRDQVANGEKGTVDLIWLNKLNFKVMKDLGLLFGPWATQLPSSGNFDFSNSAISYDAGTPIDGMEFPLHIAQAVFIKNKAFVSEEDTPVTIPQLLAWCQENPGRFTYSDPTLDFTGSALVRHFFTHFTTARGHTWEEFLALPGTGTEALYLEVAADVWAALRGLEANLWRPGYYAASHVAEINPLVANETLWIDFSFEASEATNRQDDELNPWPLTTDAYVLITGTLADTNFLAIPLNAPNKEAALVAVNYIGSAASMYVRAIPANDENGEWGAIQAFDPSAPEMIEWNVAFDYIDLHEATPSVEELSAARLADVNAVMHATINADWAVNVRDL